MHATYLHLHNQYYILSFDKIYNNTPIKVNMDINFAQQPI